MPGPPPGHDGEPEPRDGRAHLPREFVMWTVDLDAGRAKDSDAWPDKMQNAKPAQEIAHHLQKGEELGKTRARPFEEDFVRAFRGRRQG